MASSSLSLWSVATARPWVTLCAECCSLHCLALPRRPSGSPACSISGCGDALAAIAKYGIEKDVGYISTGGGAFLEVLEGKTLPAFEILMKRAAG